MTLTKYPTCAEWVREINRLCDLSFRFARYAGAGVFFGTDFAWRRNSGGVRVYKDVYAGTVIPVQENAQRARNYAQTTARMARLFRKTRRHVYTDKAIDAALFCAEIAGYVAAQDRGCKAEIAAYYN